MSTIRSVKECYFGYYRSMFYVQGSRFKVQGSRFKVQGA
jgi:hypothetical protein